MSRRRTKAKGKEYAMDIKVAGNAGSCAAKPALAAAMAICFAASARCADFTWKGDAASSWQSEGSYEEGAVPKAGDRVTVPEGCTATVTDADVEFVSNLGDVVLVKRCELVFDVANDCKVECPIHQPEESMSSRTLNVTIVKRGAGAIELASRGKITSDVIESDYRASIRVEEGALKLLQTENTAFNGHTAAIVSLYVGENAAFYTARNGTTRVFGSSFEGSGLVTNVNPTLSATESENPMFAMYMGTNTFAGTFGGNMNCMFTYSEGNTTTYLTGTNSTFTGIPIVYGHGVIGVSKFGMAGEPSSVGTHDTIEMRNKGNGIVYLGNGPETTDKDIMLGSTPFANMLDAGANGGVTFTGTFRYSGSDRKQHMLELDGSNTVAECVLSGPFNEPVLSGEYDWSTYITKKGKGVWRMADNSSRRNRGAIAVEAGTLRFDSIAETNKVCSLGLANLLRECGVYANAAEAPLVPYALLLGGSQEGATLEYTGSGEAYCRSRPIAVQGDATIRNATANGFDLAGVFGYGDGSKTLTLDGDVTSVTNRLSDITNGCGRLSIAKTGGGTWSIGGDLSFNGDVDVKEGTLIVRRDLPYYTWFRLNIKQNWQDYLQNTAGWSLTSYGASNSRAVQLQEFGLFDGDGVRRNLNLSTNNTDYAHLAENEVAFEAGIVASTQPGRCLANLFDGKATTASATFGCHMYSPLTLDSSRPTSYMRVADDTSWIRIVMRLADDTPEITRFDYSDCWGANRLETQNQNLKNSMFAYSLEGSIDGEHWNELTNVEELATCNYTDHSWTYGDAAISTADRPGAGFPIATRYHEGTMSVFEGVEQVSVAAGARLVADIRDGGMVTVKGLKLDPSAGVGAFEGVAFAAVGTLNIVNSAAALEASFTPGLVGCTDFGNIAKWSLRMDGEENGRFCFSVSGGTIRVFRRGLTISFR